jgi:PLP dependent protein
MSQEILHAYQATKTAIEKACHAANRQHEAVSLVVVSKTHGVEQIESLLKAGHRIFGENRVQEAQQKWPELKSRYPDIELHLIGPLQSNKAAEAVALFDVIETVDRDKIASALAVAMQKQGRTPKLLVQVNTGREPQKAGIYPTDVQAFLERLHVVHGLHAEGLMCIPPVNDSAAKHFALLREFATANDLALLSMGMSGDFPEAIAEGATHVRVGSAIFGGRPTAHPGMAK